MHMIHRMRARAAGKEEPAPPLNCRLLQKRPEDTTTEKTLDRVSTVVGIVTTDNLLGTLLAPLSMASGLWSLGRAQNVAGREAHFKAMAVDAAFSYVAIRGGHVPPRGEFPTETEAAVGQRILGTNDLSATFHNDRERALFNKTYADTVGVLVQAHRTEEGRTQLRRLVREYKAWGRKNPRSAGAGFFLQRR